MSGAYKNLEFRLLQPLANYVVLRIHLRFRDLAQEKFLSGIHRLLRRVARVEGDMHHRNY